MTRKEYVGKLRDLYYAANQSDVHPDDRLESLDWMNGKECSTHCRAYDKVAKDMGLSWNWLETLD